MASGRKNNKLVWWLSLLAGMQSLSAASIWSQLLSIEVAGLFAAMIGALNVGTATYVAGNRPLVDATPTPPGVAR